MEKKQYSLCLEILRRLHRAGVLGHCIIIGSWCAEFYKEYFGDEYPYLLKTRDIDFLIPSPSKIKQKTDVPKLLEDLGFIMDFQGSKGYIKLQHPDIILEFLVPEKGRGIDKPYPLPQLGMNAQTLRFLDLLTQNTIQATVEGIRIVLPHPANFAFQKLIISQRRQSEEKARKDKDSAIEILKLLIEKGKAAEIKDLYFSILESWKRKIKKVLEEEKEFDILNVLK
ncbi:MAG: hypothetical protein BWY26_00365 [Elusimicrobia bacterium ADurb.Bin231]|nr:MAG: hypothetical protein BWY26_00365 [Elusimicrobia bacterium ADurb.Bin231]